MLQSTQNSVHCNDRKNNNSTFHIVGENGDNGSCNEQEYHKVGKLFKEDSENAFLFFFGNNIFAVNTSAFLSLFRGQTFFTGSFKSRKSFGFVHTEIVQKVPLLKKLVRVIKKDYYCGKTAAIISLAKAKAYVRPAASAAAGMAKRTSLQSAAKLLPYIMNIFYH